MANGYVGRLGGADAFGLAVESFYRRVLRDPELRQYFAGIDLERLHHHQYAFLAMAVGGVKGYLGRTMAAAHAGLGITDEAFARVQDHPGHRQPAAAAALRHLRAGRRDRLRRSLKPPRMIRPPGSQ